MQSETHRIIDLLQRTYAGNAWHGSNIQTILADVSAKQASLKPITTAHSIWELVLHLTQWRTFAWQKIAGDPQFDITTPETDWPPVADSSQEAWQTALQQLDKSQEKLVEALYKFSDANLSQIVPGRDYTYYVLLHGIIQHDLYHTGQIALLKK
jgi:uncharacterized damage-inducible protein DinB